MTGRTMKDARDYDLSGLTDAQLGRVLYRLQDSAAGFDWPTLWMVRPSLAHAFDVAIIEGKRRNRARGERGL